LNIIRGKTFDLQVFGTIGYTQLHQSFRRDSKQASGLKQGQSEKDQIEEKIDFDMKDVNFISSSFIRICLITFKDCQKGNFTIINCDPF